MKGPLLVLSIICWLLIFLFGVNADAQTNQVVINGTSTTAVDFGGAGCVYKWTNSNPAIGLPASGTGDIASFTAINTGTSPVIATITATPASSGFAYIVNGNNNTASILNTVTHTVVSTFNVTAAQGVQQNEYNAVTLNADGSRLYIAADEASPANTISVLNTSTNSLISTLNVIAFPSGIVFSPDGSLFYVACTGPFFHGVLYVFKASDNTLINQIDLNISPYSIALSPDGSRLYFTDPFGYIIVLDALNFTQLASLQYANRPIAVAVSPDGKRFYVSDEFKNNVLVINSATLEIISTVPVGRMPQNIIVSPDGSKIFVVNTTSSNVSVIDGFTNKVISTIDVGASPLGGSLSPDGNQLYVENSGSQSVSVINTSDYSIITTVPVGNFPDSFGNFISAGIGCSSKPITFTITVNPTLPPVITTSTITGTISSCQGTVSISPNIQQFTVSCANLTANVNASAPSGFEISTDPSIDFATSLTIAQTAGNVGGIIIYVRSASTAPAGNITGNVVLSSAGAVSQNVAVSGTVNALPVVNPVVNQALTEGDASTAVNFTGTADSYTWVNDNPAIGLPANGNGDIPVFTAINTGKTRLIANITITPNSNSGCSGTPVSFNISVNPEPPPQIDFDATAFSSLTTSYGTPSTSTSFTLSPIYLRGGILVTPPLGFEVSTDNSTFNSTVLVGQAGSIATITIYIRLASTTAVGHYSGNIKLSSIDAFDTNFGMTDSEVTPAILALKAEDVNKTYGATLTGGPGLTNFTSTGLQNSETIGSVTVAYGAGAAATDPVNTYTGSVVVSAATGGTFSPSNYVINYTPGDIILTPAPLIAAVDNKSKVFDTVNPVFTISYSGFVNNETASVFTAGPVITTTALTNSPAGQYPITASGAEAQNYTITYIPGVLTITVLVQEVVVPNAFTPNGDGINDFWDIKYLNLYPKCIVSVYARYGERVYSSVGYGVAWDGTYKGAQLPTGTYYYIIDPQSGSKIMSGYITIIR